MLKLTSCILLLNTVNLYEFQYISNDVICVENSIDDLYDINFLPNEKI